MHDQEKNCMKVIGQNQVVISLLISRNYLLLSVSLPFLFLLLINSQDIAGFRKINRRGWDSNPGSPKGQRFSRPPRSTAPAPLLRYLNTKQG